MALSFLRLEAQFVAQDYPDGNNGSVHFPLGNFSFADEVVSFKPGTPYTIDSLAMIPGNCLGMPDYRDKSSKYSLTLGCGGEIILRFKDNALINVEGPDLYVFEIGSNIEPTELAISKDGQIWITAGRISGGKASVDIAPYVQPDDIFYFVRLTDLKQDCGSIWPGADIDAIGAIGAALQLSLNSTLLFETGKSVLKKDATSALDAALMQLPSGGKFRIVVEGHTDSSGDGPGNTALSLQRAASVKAYILKRQGIREDMIAIRGYGETMPVASNETEGGRMLNRRVTILIQPIDK